VPGAQALQLSYDLLVLFQSSFSNINILINESLSASVSSQPSGLALLSQTVLLLNEVFIGLESQVVMASGASSGFAAGLSCPSQSFPPPPSSGEQGGSGGGNSQIARKHAAKHHHRAQRHH